MFDSGRPVVQIASIKLVANGLNSIGSLDSIRNHLQIVNKNLFKLLVQPSAFSVVCQLVVPISVGSAATTSMLFKTS